jgi:hypothetical protein
VPLSEIPHFYSAITRAAYQVTTVRVECDTRNTLVVCIIVLNEALRPDIPYLYRFIRTAGGNTGAVRMESNCVDTLAVILE